MHHLTYRISSLLHSVNLWGFFHFRRIWSYLSTWPLTCFRRSTSYVTEGVIVWRSQRDVALWNVNCEMCRLGQSKGHLGPSRGRLDVSRTKAVDDSSSSQWFLIAEHVFVVIIETRLDYDDTVLNDSNVEKWSAEQFSGSVYGEPEFPGGCVNSAEVRTLASTAFRVNVRSPVRRSTTDPEDCDFEFQAEASILPKSDEDRTLTSTVTPWLTSSYVYHLITVIAFVLTICHSLDLSLQT